MPASHKVSARLVGKGYHGLIVNSFAKGAGVEDLNIVFWNCSATPPNQVFVIDDENRLPRNRRS